MIKKLRSFWWDVQYVVRGVSVWLKAGAPTLHQALKIVYRKVVRRPPKVDTKVERIDLPYGEILTVDGIRMRIHKSLSPKQVQRLVSGSHTRTERTMILGVLEPSDIVMELGGGIGMVSIACAKVVGSDRVFTYEANPLLQPLIQENYGLNQVAPTVKMCMLGKERGQAQFHISPNFSESSTFKHENFDRTVEVEVLPVGEEMARIRPTALIMDIQGGEKDLLPHIDLSTVKTFLLELHPDVVGAWHTNAIRRRLRRLGFAEISHDKHCFLYQRN